ncbi:MULTISPECIES: DUF2938 domain-containing protein [Vibrio]|uniref:DUF2938 domain-containing protein n=1 Tax=Vibrio casei TaxID=673372 RepID=A0A368LJ86_9VIBR|nr:MULTISPECIES: DUF2938 domain-containing protein [Vibrio]RCS70810.1 DUF2938 domain-containing protein [Vibrio casei]SJN30325.1 putative membrane protein [Vibrio casei]HBV76871.1 DUF2938 domain-containing protein [Vibrio sp.]
MNTLSIIIIGMGATAIMDLWAWFQKHVLGIPSLNYALVGRWVGYLPKGQWRHKTIMQTPPLPKEAIVGWLLHYFIGVVFSALTALIFGQAWLAQPSLMPALLIGITTLIFPFFIMQPCLGFGVAASQTPAPWRARFFSFLAHTSYALGLFFCAYGLTILRTLL